MEEVSGEIRNRPARLLLLGFLALVMVLDVAAQGPDGPVSQGWRPFRLPETERQQREPRVLAHSVTSEGLSSTVLELPAEADTYIASRWPNQNFGTGALYLGYNLSGDTSFGAERILLRFDVTSSIPPGAVVHDARLRLYLAFSSPGKDVPMGTIVRQLASTWSETDVTWNREPTWGPIRADRDIGSAVGWYEWDITELVEEWTSGLQVNHGVEIIGDERVQERERAFYSVETTNTLYPRLVVDYTDLDDTEAPIVTVDALPTFSRRDFTVSWSGTDSGGSGIASYDVQYRIDGGEWTNWLIDAVTQSAVFAAGQDGQLYDFRARGEDRAGNVEAFGAPEASTIVDTRPPTTTVDPLPVIINDTTFTVSWTGHDDASGIQYYDVQYRYNGGSWFLWQDRSLATNTQFTTINDGLYEFEARAVDQLGLQEDFGDRAEASIIVDAASPFVEPKAWLPIVFHSE